ncbi:hypothetical protein YC2023_009996 [Brassica napus]
MELNGEARISGERPIITVSNDDGIDCAWSSCSRSRPCLHQPLRHIFREKSAVSHSIIWSRPLTAQRVEIDGAEAYAVCGLFSTIATEFMDKSLELLDLMFCQICWLLPFLFCYKSISNGSIRKSI